MKVAQRIVKRSKTRVRGTLSVSVKGRGVGTWQYSSADAAAQNRTRGQSGERRRKDGGSRGHVHPAPHAVCYYSALALLPGCYPFILPGELLCRSRFFGGREVNRIRNPPPNPFAGNGRDPSLAALPGFLQVEPGKRARRRQPSARTTEEMLQVFEASPDLTSDDSLFRRGVLE